MEKQKLILGLQAISATGILVLGLLSYFGQSTRDLRVEIKDEFVIVREEFAAVRKEMKEEFAAVRKEIKEEFAAVRKEMKEEFAAVRKEMREEFAAVRKEMRDTNTRLGRVEGHLGILPVQKPVP